MMPEVSAGSNHVGASATCEAQVIWPEGALADCADACVAATSATAAARAIVRARERVMVCPPLRCDKSETWLAGCEVDRLSPNPSGCQWGRERRTRAIAGACRSMLASPAHGRHPRLGRALLARRHCPAGALASHREAGGNRPRRPLLHTWANVTVIRTTAGLVLVDTGSYASRARTFAAVRAVDRRPVHAAVYTHGHVDHACGL